MSAAIPPHPRQPRSSTVWQAVSVLLLLVAAFCTWGCARAPSAYGYVTGTEVVATTTEGAVCTTQVVIRRGRGGTTCPATWTVDGRTVQGTLTTHYGGPAVAISGGPSSYRVTAWGSTAATGYDRFDLWWGLLGPAGLLLSVAGMVVGLGGMDRRLAHRVARDLDGGRAVPWGPFTVRADGLGVGELHLPWTEVQVLSTGKVKGPMGPERTVTLELTGRATGELGPRKLPHAGAFTRVVRARTAGSADGRAPGVSLR